MGENEDRDIKEGIVVKKKSRDTEGSRVSHGQRGRSEMREKDSDGYSTCSELEKSKGGEKKGRQWRMKKGGKMSRLILFYLQDTSSCC